MARSLIVLPDDSAKPILDGIDGARRSIRIKMFAFSDPALIKATIAAKRRGVKVRVMLNAERRSGERDNDATRKGLLRAGVDAQLVVFEALPHAFWYHFEFPETTEVLELMAKFFDEKVGR